MSLSDVKEEGLCRDINISTSECVYSFSNKCFTVENTFSCTNFQSCWKNASSSSRKMSGKKPQVEKLHL